MDDEIYENEDAAYFQSDTRLINSSSVLLEQKLYLVLNLTRGALPGPGPFPARAISKCILMVGAYYGLIVSVTVSA